jgi:hypothetical protein
MQKFLVVAMGLSLLAGTAQAQALPPSAPNWGVAQPPAPEKPKRQQEFAPVQQLKPIESMKPLEPPRTSGIQPVRPPAMPQEPKLNTQSVYTIPNPIYPEANHKKQPASSYAPPN